LKQRSTITRPYSIYSSTFSLPTAYHENTTPYGDYGEKFENAVFDENDLYEEQEDDFTDIVEAINPNVQVINTE
jgi:hypothetical protein